MHAIAVVEDEVRELVRRRGLDPAADPGAGTTFASTRQGGPGASIMGVPPGEARRQGGKLTGFYSSTTELALAMDYAGFRRDLADARRSVLAETRRSGHTGHITKALLNRPDWAMLHRRVLSHPRVWLNSAPACIDARNHDLECDEYPAVLTTEFGPESVKISVPEVSYEIPYASLTHVVQFDDVLVLKPNNHLTLALPMELVRPQDLALLRSKVTNRPMREASIR